MLKIEHRNVLQLFTYIHSKIKTQIYECIPITNALIISNITDLYNLITIVLKARKQNLFYHRQFNIRFLGF